MAKRTTRNKKPKSTAATSLPGWIWLLTGLVIGLSATFLPPFNERHDNRASSIQNDKEVPDIESRSSRKFDFYTLLPELEVVVDSSNQRPMPNNTTPSEIGIYVLQVGSFKGHNEADSLKARLALMGVETNIEIVTVNSSKWHRVRVGPSTDQNRLLSIQKRLRNEKMDSVLLKVRS